MGPSDILSEMGVAGRGGSATEMGRSGFRLSFSLRSVLAECPFVLF